MTINDLEMIYFKVYTHKDDKHSFAFTISDGQLDALFMMQDEWVVRRIKPTFNLDRQIQRKIDEIVECEKYERKHTKSIDRMMFGL